MKKIYTITFHASHNCGSCLQAYALQEFVKTLSNNCEYKIINLRKPVQDEMNKLIFYKKGIKNKEDILKDWINFREEDLLRYVTEEDKKYNIYFDEISDNILKNVPAQNKKYAEKQLEKLNKNYMDYFDYWTEKYFRNGFVDGIQIIVKCINS